MLLLMLLTPQIFFIIMLNNEWALSGECVDEYNLAKRMNLTSYETNKVKRPEPRRPVFIPIAYSNLDWNAHKHVRLLAASTNMIPHNGLNLKEGDFQSTMNTVLASIQKVIQMAGAPGASTPAAAATPAPAAPAAKAKAAVVEEDQAGEAENDEEEEEAPQEEEDDQAGEAENDEEEEEAPRRKQKPKRAVKKRYQEEEEEEENNEEDDDQAGEAENEEEEEEEQQNDDEEEEDDEEAKAKKKKKHSANMKALAKLMKKLKGK